MDSKDAHALKKEKEKHLVKGNSSGKTCVVYLTWYSISIWLVGECEVGIYLFQARMNSF